MRSAGLFAAEFLACAGGKPRVYSSTEMAGVSVAIGLLLFGALIAACLA